jgi:NAD(P)-dependent dehydrogenase (short-subunit alcohol dehydrogenase family)
MSQRKEILIVGAERGLGLGLAEQFFDRGWNVVGTARRGDDIGALRSIGTDYPTRLAVEYVDVVEPGDAVRLHEALGDRRFDVIFLNAGIWGPMHQSVQEATRDEVAMVFMTNAVGPMRLARTLSVHLAQEGGTFAFMSSHRASIGANIEGGLELYRASKAASNMLTRGLYADLKSGGHTVLNIHPGWVNTDMGTLGGTVGYEIELEPSVRGVADVVERHMGSGIQLFIDYQDQPLPW